MISRSLLFLFSVVLMVACDSAVVEASPVPNFGHRRLLNLSGNSVGTANLSGNSVGLNSAESMSVPSSLAVESGNTAFLYLKAEGFQEYEFTDSSTWILKSALADLFSDGKHFGTHYYLLHKDAHGGQPTWKSFDPASVVTGTSIASESVSSTAISWSLFQATSSSGSSSVFGSVTYVQRLNTDEGLPPDSSELAKSGDTYNSPYSATYVFYAKK